MDYLIKLKASEATWRTLGTDLNVGCRKNLTSQHIDLNSQSLWEIGFRSLEIYNHSVPVSKLLSP